MKTTSQYVCEECGAVSSKWIGKCPACEKWNTYVEEIVEKPAKTFTAVKTSKPLALSEIKKERLARVSSGISELDNVLGGGIVPSSLILIGGDPGIGKSTLLTQAAGNLAEKHKVLYACAEESASQVKMRCERLKINQSGLFLLSETNLDSILDNVVGRADFGAPHGIDFLIIDSIQAVYLSGLQSPAGSISQIKECAAKLMRVCKSENITVFVVGHVTKDGNIAGPKVLEHIMDTVLYFESEPSDNYKILRAVKNRFGSLDEIGVFEMTAEGVAGVKNYSDIFISENKGLCGSALTPVINGSRCMTVEIQSLLTKTVFGNPRRMSAGIDFNKLHLMLAVLEKRAGIPFYSHDVYLNAVGGLKITQPSIDLAVCLSLASSHKNLSVDSGTAVFGEVGLSGEIRSVLFAEKRINESIRLGAKKVIFPYGNLKSCEKFSDKINLLPVKTIGQAVEKAFILS